MELRRPRTIDGVRHTAPRRPYAGPGAAAAAAAAHRPAAVPTKQARPFQIIPTGTGRVGFWQRFQLPLLIFGGVLAGYLVQSLALGMILIAGYSVIALTIRVPSHISFTLAFMALVTVVILLAVKNDTALAGNFATYTFLFLVIGVIALAIEARPPVRRKRPKRPGRGKRSS